MQLLVGVTPTHCPEITLPEPRKTSSTSPLSRRRLAALAAATAAFTAAALSGSSLAPARRVGTSTPRRRCSTPPTDLTDVYAFTSPDNADMVTLIANVRPFQVPGTAANALVDYPFATGARYEIHADADGDGAPETTYRWTFRDDDRRPFGMGRRSGRCR